MYSDEQLTNAKVIWDFWHEKGAGDLGSAAWCGNGEGEDSLIPSRKGDNDQAKGLGQWHKLRRGLILQKTGIDVWNAPVAAQCEAQFLEISADWSSYRHVWALFQSAQTLEGKVAVIVSKFEQSGSQGRDIARRTGMAQGWLSKFGGK